MGESTTELGGELTVLVLDEDLTVRETIRSYARNNYENLRVREHTDRQEALEQLQHGSIDCLVVNPEALDGEPEAFLEDCDDLAMGCPIVWLTEQSPAELDDALLGAGTTIVEKGDDLTEWSFLFEKIQSSIQQSTISDRDSDLFRTLVEAASDGLYTLDASGRVVYLNEAFADILGYNQGELFGVHASMVMADGELERGQQLIQELLEADDGETDIMDMDMVRKDGTPITVAVHFRVLTTHDGTYNGVMGVVRDVTERKRRERELQRQRDRLEDFASIVSHDLQTPLTVAKGRVQLAREDYESEDLDAAAEALERMERLITDLLELAQQGEIVEIRESVDLDAVASDAWQDVASQTPAELHTDLEGYTVWGDAERLRQLLQNLFRNAIDHGGPDVIVTVGQTENARGFYVEDDGPGIPEKLRDQVFNRAYTTSEDGTGFGLVIVDQIVQAHNWMITLSEADGGGGARFEITTEA